MNSATHRETDREPGEVTLLELCAVEWDERQLQRGPVRYLAEDDDETDDGELDNEAHGSCRGGPPPGEKGTRHPPGAGHCH